RPGLPRRRGRARRGGDPRGDRRQPVSLHRLHEDRRGDRARRAGRRLVIEPPVESPRSLAEAYEILAAAPHRPVAGGTDLLVQITGEIGQPPERVLDLWRLDELRGISLEGNALVLGALTTYTDIRRSALCREHLPALVEAA